MLTFCCAFDGLHCKKEDKVVPTTVDLCNQNMERCWLSDQVMYSYAFEWGENHGQKRLFYMPSKEFLYTLRTNFGTS